MSLILLIICIAGTALAVALRLLFHKSRNKCQPLFWASVILGITGEAFGIATLTVAGCIMTDPPAPLWHVNVAGVLSLFDFLFTVLSALDEP